MDSRAAARPEVELRAGTQIIGDLHLDPDNAEQVRGFRDRLTEARGLPRLVILGDLFEYWVGPAQLDSALAVIEAMRSLVDSGTPIDVIPGNRDFLLEARFERSSGAVLRPAGFVGELEPGAAPDKRVLLIHGDELCTLDRPYQRMRRMLRSRPLRALASAVPGPIARGLALRLRSASRRAIERKPGLEMAQQPATCIDLARRADCRTLVCGHAHAYRDDRLDDGLRWLVVDAFGGPRDTLEVSGQGELRVLQH